MTKRTIIVDAEALGQVLDALTRPTYHIAEMQVTRSLHALGGMYSNPIETLREQFKDGGVAPESKAAVMPPMTDSLREVLGLPVHQYIPIVRALQRVDPDIKNRFEDEQAALLYWALTFWFKHGDGWRAAAAEELKRLADEASAGGPAA